MRKYVYPEVLRLVFSVCAVILGLTLCFGSASLKETVSFYYVTALPGAWLVCGIFFAVGGVLMCTPRTPVGYFLSSTTYTFLAGAVCLAWLTHHHGSVFAPISMVQLASSNWTMFRATLWNKVDPGRQIESGV